MPAKSGGVDYAASLRKIREHMNPRSILKQDKEAIFLAWTILGDSDRDCPFALQKLAAQLVLREADPLRTPDVRNPAMFVALVEEAELNEFLKYLLAYEERLRTIGGKLDDAALALYTTVIQRCVKLRSVISESTDDMWNLGVTLLNEGVKLNEFRSEDLSHLLKASVKFMCASSDQYAVLFNYCVDEYPPDITSKWLLLSVLLPSVNDALILSLLPSLCSEVESLCHSQTGTSSSASFVVSLCSRFGENPEIEDLIYRSISSLDRATRVNSLRYWLGRILGVSSLRPFLLKILRKCVDGVEDAKNEEVWPPSTSSQWEEVCCVSADWDWHEAEEVVYKADALIMAALTIVLGLSTSHASKKACLLKSEFLFSALRWHSIPVRLLAFQVLQACLAKENLVEDFDRETVLSELALFVIRNKCCENSDIQTQIRDVTPQIRWTEEQLNEWKAVVEGESTSEEEVLLALEVVTDLTTSALVRLLRSPYDSVRRRAIRKISLIKKLPEESGLLIGEVQTLLEQTVKEAGWSSERSLDILHLRMTLRDDVDLEGYRCSDDELGKLSLLQRLVVWEKHVTTKEIDSSFARLEELLRLSGSSSIEECPTFPVFYDNVSIAGFEQKHFARIVFKHCEFLARCARKGICDVEKAIGQIWSVLMRCRHKSVVDNGTALLPELLSLDKSLAKEIFRKTLSLLLSSVACARTLSLSKTLWSCCEKDRSLHDELWKSIKSCLESQHAPIVQIRALKTMKYFLVREQCPLSNSDVLQFLFKYSIRIQNEDSDFLVKSAATILYGFVVQLICGRREKIFLFELIGSLLEVWTTVKGAADKIKETPQACRVLLLAFLQRVRLGSEVFYAESSLRSMADLRDSIIELLGVTGDARERRFIVEVIVALTSYKERPQLLHEVSRELLSVDTWIQRQTLAYMKCILEENHTPTQGANNSRVPTDLAMRPYGKTIQNFVDFSREWKSLDRGAVLTTAREMLNALHRNTKWDHELSANTFAYCVYALAKRKEEEEDRDNDPSYWNCWNFSLKKALRHGGRPASIAARAAYKAGLCPGFWQSEEVLKACHFGQNCDKCLGAE